MQPDSPPPSRNFILPVAINLGVLLLGAILLGADALGFVVIALFVINVLAAIIMVFSKRIHYVLAFILSAVVVLLVGFGACMFILSNIGHGP